MTKRLLTSFLVMRVSINTEHCPVAKWTMGQQCFSNFNLYLLLCNEVDPDMTRKSRHFKSFPIASGSRLVLAGVSDGFSDNAFGQILACDGAEGRPETAALTAAEHVARR